VRLLHAEGPDDLRTVGEQLFDAGQECRRAAAARPHAVTADPFSCTTGTSPSADVPVGSGMNCAYCATGTAAFACKNPSDCVEPFAWLTCALKEYDR
jgi:hypothetical protein